MYTTEYLRLSVLPYPGGSQISIVRESTYADVKSTCRSIDPVLETVIIPRFRPYGRAGTDLRYYFYIDGCDYKEIAWIIQRRRFYASVCWMALFTTIRHAFTNKKGRTIAVLPFFLHNHNRFIGSFMKPSIRSEFHCTYFILSRSL
jgi:hypothetical protein